jgi:hypothetical protein
MEEEHRPKSGKGVGRYLKHRGEERNGPFRATGGPTRRCQKLIEDKVITQMRKEDER